MTGTAAAVGLQIPTTEPRISPQMQSLHTQPGHTVWLYSAESLNLSGRHLPGSLQQIKAFHLVACVDHYYLDLDPSEEAFNAAGDAKLELVPILKTAFAVAEEIVTFARGRGCVVLTDFMDKPKADVEQLWLQLFSDTPDNPTLRDRLNALPSKDSLPERFRSARAGVAEALTSAMTWREFYLTARLRSVAASPMTEQERKYFAEADLRIPDEAAANQAQELADVQGSAMGDAIGAAIGKAIAESRAETVAIVSEAVKGIGAIITPVIATVNELKGEKDNGKSKEGDGGKGQSGNRPNANR
jgi:hypothetical protein